MDAEDIVRALAARGALRHGTHLECAFCDQPPGVTHMDDCLWCLARLWVEAHPAPGAYVFEPDLSVSQSADPPWWHRDRQHGH